jgi:hypothetical protein
VHAALWYELFSAEALSAVSSLVVRVGFRIMKCPYSSSALLLIVLAIWILLSIFGGLLNPAIADAAR